MAEGTANGAASGVAHPRRKYLVDRAFQLKYALLLAGAGIAVAVVFGVWIHQAHEQFLDVAGVHPALRPALAHSERQIFYVLAGIAVLMAGALGLVGVVMTHRVAGPLFVLGHYMSVLARGRYPRMRTLRRRDELKPFFGLFLRSVEALKARDAAHVALLEETLDRLRGNAARSPEIAAALEPLAEAARERRAALSVDDPEPTPFYIPAARAAGAPERPV